MKYKLGKTPRLEIITVIFLLVLCFLSPGSSITPAEAASDTLGCCLRAINAQGTVYAYCQEQTEGEASTECLSGYFEYDQYTDTFCDDVVPNCEPAGCCRVESGGVFFCDYNQYGGTQHGPAAGQGVYKEYCDDEGGAFSPGVVGTSCQALCGGAPGYGTITGTVRDQDTDDPLPGAIVTIPSQGLSTTAGSGGTYTISNVAAGVVSVEASLTGYQVRVQSATITDQGTTTLNFDLVPIPGAQYWTATVYVTDTEANDLADEDLPVTISWSTNTISGETKTYGQPPTHDHPVVFDGLPKGDTINFDVTAPGYQSYFEEYFAPSDQDDRTFYFELLEGTSTLCGNDFVDTGEECDGTSSALCPGDCQVDCTCPNNCWEAQGESDPVIGQQFCGFFVSQCTVPGGSVDKGPGGIYNTSCPQLNQAVPYPRSSGVCCSVPVDSIPACLNEQRVGDISPDIYGYCRCGTTYLSTTAQASLYCCGGYVQSGGCVFGTIWGVVTNQVSGTAITGATINLQPTAGGSGITTTTAFGVYHGVASDGLYLRNDVPVGTYTMTVSKSGFITETINDIVITANQEVRQDAELIPEGAEVCANPEYMPEPDGANVQHTATQGEPDGILHWHMQCPEKVERYIIYEQLGTGIWQPREEVMGADAQASYTIPLDYPLGDYPPIGDDPNGVCDQLLTYKIVAVPKPTLGLAASEGFAPPYYPGDCICMGIEDTMNRFCLYDGGGQHATPDQPAPDALPTVRAYCSADNQALKYDDCRITGGTGVCVDPPGEPPSGAPYCADPEQCENLGIPGTVPGDWNAFNIFGLYYDKVYTAQGFDYTCLKKSPAGQGQWTNRYCYMDYSPTTVDACYSCTGVTSCYDYDSPSACDAALYPTTGDHCGAGGRTVPGEQHPCMWYETEFAEFGKGICYAEGYSDDDKCSMCGPSAGLFKNIGCNQTVCDLLGDCYANAAQTQCIACTPTVSCYDYTTEAACEGGREFDITPPWGETGWLWLQSGTPDNIIPSNDACHRETCRWTGSSCIKDGNDDNRDDCMSSPVPACRQDNTPPSIIIDYTTIPAAKYLNKDGPLVPFKSSTGELAPNFAVQWCIIEDDPQGEHDIEDADCKPTYISSAAQNHQVDIISTYGFLATPTEKWYVIRYFGLDIHNNSGILQEDSIFIDTIPPQVTISGPTPVYPSDPGIQVSSIQASFFENSGKDMFCQDRLRGPGGYDSAQLSYLELLETSSADPKLITYTNLQDGNYYFELTCKDEHGNEVIVIQQPVLVKLNTEIYDEQPTGTITDSSPELSIKTEFQYNRCEFSVDNAPFAGYYGCGAAPCPETGSGYWLWRHELTGTAAGTENGYHTVNIQCRETAGGGWDKTTSYTFANDRSAPTTTIYNVWGATSTPVPSGAELYETLFFYKFTCLDPSLPDIMHSPSTVDEQWGCGVTKYCAVQGTVPCSPTTTYTSETVISLANPGTTGDYKICYATPDDAEGQYTPNIEATKCITVHLDSRPADINISILPFYGSPIVYNPGKTKIAKNNRYRIIINTSKPVFLVDPETDFSFELDAFDPGEFENGEHYYLTYLGPVTGTCEPTGACTQFYYDLDLIEHAIYDTVPPPNNIQGQFHISLQDPYYIISDDDQVDEGRLFEIDIFGPNPPTIHYPQGLAADMSDIVLSIINYKIYGISQAASSRVYIESITGGFTQYVLTAPVSIQHATGTVSQVVDTHTVRISSSTINEFQIGRYIEFPAQLRGTKERYRITSATPSGGSVTVTVTPDFETTPSGSATLYYESVPTGWFMIDPYNFPSPGIEIGENTYVIWGVDDVLNPSDEISFELLYAPFIPDVLMYYPMPGDILTEVPVHVGAYVTMATSMPEFDLDTDSVNLAITGPGYSKTFTCDDPDFTCTKKTSIPFLTWNLTGPIDTLQNNIYNVQLSFASEGGHQVTKTWIFEYNTDAPTLVSANIVTTPPSRFRASTNRWYVPTTTGLFRVAFNPAQTVEIVLARVTDGGSWTRDLTCENRGGGIYHCQFPADMSIEQQYTFILRAHRMIGAGWGPTVEWTRNFRLDLSAPVVTLTLSDRLRRDHLDIPLEATVSDASIWEAQDLGFVTFYGDVMTAQNGVLYTQGTELKAQPLGDININYITDRDGNYTVAVRVRDYVGHQTIKADSVIIDKTIIPECMDGWDNDHDGKVDYCTSGSLNIIGGPCDVGCRDEYSDSERYCTDTYGAGGCPAPSAVCGNGVIDLGETCDPGASGIPADLGLVRVCTDLGFDGPTGQSISCIAAGQPNQCHFNTNACTQDSTCGNGILEPGEQCEPPGRTGACQDMGFPAGTWVCDQQCKIDIGGCDAGELACDGILQPGEECDDLPGGGENFGGLTCDDFGYSGGYLTCYTGAPACSTIGAIDISSCTYSPDPTDCGDSQIDIGESCDGTQFGSVDQCADFGWAGGALTCNGCDVTSGACECSTSLHDGMIQPGETCDDDQGVPYFAGMNCESYDLGIGIYPLDCLNGVTDTADCLRIVTHGNDLIEPSEHCDGTVMPPGFSICSDYVYQGGSGALSCNAQAKLDISTCTTDFTHLGNGAIDPGEVCDIDGATGAPIFQPGVNCQDFGFSGGSLLCQFGIIRTENCLLTSTCGNGVIEPGEQCDKGPPPVFANDANTCEDFNLGGGAVLACTAACTIDTNACDCATSVCGNGVIEPGETCEWDNSVAVFGGKTCSDYGFSSGSMHCIEEGLPGQCTVDTSYCVLEGVCGDGTLQQPGEICDGTQFAPGITSCSDINGFSQGVLGCAGCHLETSQCIIQGGQYSCGNGNADPGEQCDTFDLRGVTCASLGISGPGALSCSPGCTFNTFTCGGQYDGTLPGQECSAGSAPVVPCTLFDFKPGGTISCSAIGFLNTGACIMRPPQCSDGIDNDVDGLTDMGDSDCKSAVDPFEVSAYPPSVSSDTHPDPSEIYSASTVHYIWQMHDRYGMNGYSYLGDVPSGASSAIPDQDETNSSSSGLWGTSADASIEYAPNSVSYARTIQFRVRPKDIAGNWWDNYSTYYVQIDNRGPGLGTIEVGDS